MSNNVTHRAVVTGKPDDVQAFMDKMIKEDEDDDDGEKCLDFNAVIPMPEDLRGVTASSWHLEWFALGYTSEERKNALGHGPLDMTWVSEAGINTREALLDHLSKRRPAKLEEAKAAWERQQWHGYSDWYRWSLDHWGTKWNSYSYHEVSLSMGSTARLEFMFDTAWSPPIPVFAKMAEEFPELEFEIAYYDEGGAFAGSVHMEGGRYENVGYEPSNAMFRQVYGYGMDECEE